PVLAAGSMLTDGVLRRPTAKAPADPTSTPVALKELAHADASPQDRGPPDPSLARLRHAIDHAAHLLPSQGPITVFVHHNTLHAFEHLPFDEAVREGAATYGCHPYLPEEFYRRAVARGRIHPDDLAEVLIDDLGENGDLLIGF